MARELEIVCGIEYQDGARSLKGPGERGVGRFTVDLANAAVFEATQAFGAAPPQKVELGDVEGQKAWVLVRNLHGADPIYLYSDDTVVQTLFAEVPPGGVTGPLRFGAGLTLYAIGSANNPELKVWAVKG